MACGLYLYAFADEHNMHYCEQCERENTCSPDCNERKACHWIGKESR